MKHVNKSTCYGLDRENWSDWSGSCDGVWAGKGLALAGWGNATDRSLFPAGAKFRASTIPAVSTNKSWSRLCSFSFTS